MRLKHLIILFFCNIATPLFSQNEYSNYYEPEKSWIVQDYQIIHSENGSMLVTYYYDRIQKENKHTTLHKFDENGRLTSVSYLDKNKKELPIVIITYHLNGDIASITRYKDGKLQSHDVFSRGVS